MSSKPTDSRSIASQLVVLFTLAATLLLCCGMGVLYWLVVRHAFEEDNTVLLDKLDAVHAEVSAARGPAVLQEEMRDVRAGERVAYWIRILDGGDRPIAETPGMATLLPPNIFPTAQSPDARARKPKDYRTRDRLFSLIATTEEAAGQRYTIQLAQDRSEDDRFLKKLGALLAILLSLGVLVSIVIGITVTKRGLRPLAQITESLRRVGPKQLHERVAPAGWPREIQPLAVAFDEMLDRLEDSFTRLSQFSADLAHELRTPLANIRGEAEVALTRARTADQYREVIESSVSECERLSGIVDNLLFLARAEAAEGHIQRVVFEGRPAIQKIASLYEPIAEEQHVSLICSGDGKVYADEMLFGRAVSNLVENALHFTPAGGTIDLSIASTPLETEISVRDTGSGIPAEHLPRVFDRFYRADTSRSSEGSGLGLALVRSIAQLHGGSAAIKSEVHRGTIVTLTFPSQNRS